MAGALKVKSGVLSNIPIWCRLYLRGMVEQMLARAGQEQEG
jgi:hypothetical protein